MIDQRKKGRWELYRQNWANWHVMHPDPIKNERRPQVQAPASPMKTRDKLKLVAWGGLILGCLYGMWPHPPYDPYAADPTLITRQIAAMPNYWVLMCPPYDLPGDDPDLNAPRDMWQVGSGPGSWTKAACEKQLTGMLESCRCEASHDVIKERS